MRFIQCTLQDKCKLMKKEIPSFRCWKKSKASATTPLNKKSYEFPRKPIRGIPLFLDCRNHAVGTAGILKAVQIHKPIISDTEKYNNILYIIY